MTQHEVYLVLKDGKNLPPKVQIPKTSDPLVNFKVGKERKNSSVKQKTLNPVWNEEFSFILDHLNGEIVIEGMGLLY